MNNIVQLCNAITEQITISDAVQMYLPALKPIRNRIPCPIHGGEHYNLGFTEHVYHCFVCDDAGNVIRFVQHIFRLPPMAAVKKINEDFKLNLPIDRRATIREQRDMMRIQEKKLREMNEREERKRAESAIYWALLDEWIRLDNIIRDCAPKDSTEPFSGEYVDAVKRIDYVEYLLDGV